MKSHKEYLINQIIETWLSDAQSHFINPQRKELEPLDIAVVEALIKTNPHDEIRVSEDVFDECMKVISRMSRRRRITQLINEAKKDGLYDESEHLTSKVFADISEEHLKYLHNKSIYNKTDIENSKYCGCFYCIRTFLAGTKIEEWVDPNKDTALCPYCGIDSVLPDSVADIDTHTLHQMNEHYFSRGTTYKMKDGKIVEEKPWDGRKKT